MTANACHCAGRSVVSVIELRTVCPSCEGRGREHCQSCNIERRPEGGYAGCLLCSGEGDYWCVDCHGTGGPVYVELLDGHPVGRVDAVGAELRDLVRAVDGWLSEWASRGGIVRDRRYRELKRLHGRPLEILASHRKSVSWVATIYRLTPDGLERRFNVSVYDSREEAERAALHHLDRPWWGLPWGRR